jgi:subtilase family serine protease/sugar lactone lactonase YvrE
MTIQSQRKTVVLLRILWFGLVLHHRSIEKTDPSTGRHNCVAGCFAFVSIERRKMMNLRTIARSFLGQAALFCASAFLLFSSQGHAQPTFQVLHHHVRPAASNGQAALVGPVSSTERMQLSIVLPLRNQAGLTALMGQLYDPSSPNYRHFLSVDQFTEQFGPTAEDYQAVVDFAQANGLTVTDRPANRMIVPVNGSVEQINKAFHVRMNNYQHPTENRTFFSPDREPSLALSVPVAHIAGLNNFSIPRPMVMKASSGQGVSNAAVVGSGPGGSYLASDMRAAYYTSTLPTGTALTGSGQTVGLVEFDGYHISDVVSSFDGTATESANGSNYVLAYTPTVGGTTYNVHINNVLLDGATGAPVSGNDSEEVLDIVQAIGMAPGLSQVRVYIGNSDADILNAIAAEDLAQQVSISWGWNPDDPSTDDFIFQEMAAQGQSVFVASGDDGAFDPLEDVFYPGEDAWVTSVGGTDLLTNGASGAWSSETAWDQSGGGISPDGIPIPNWQIGVANASNGGSTTLRNVPDVAAEADYDNYDCNMGVCQGTWAGTSFAAPRWAGFMALVNQQAVAAGNPTVGFINPAIYAIGEGSSYDNDFHDITSGNNGSTIYLATAPIRLAGFNAVTGYDLITGWGSPAGQKLIDALAPPASVGFQLLASPNSLTVNPGAFGITTITVKDTGGFTGSVNLSVSGLPSGITASFGTNPATGSSVLTLTASNSAIRGSYLVTITGASGTVTLATSVALEVDAPGFTISPSPTKLWLNAGTSGADTIWVTDFAGFTGSVNLAVTSGLPSGVTASWSANPTSGTSVLTLTASSTATIGVTMVTITGTSGALTATTTLALTIYGPEFYLNISPYPYNIVRSGSAIATVTVVPIGNFTGSVALEASELPAGVTATFNPSSTTGTSVLTMNASSSAPVRTSSVQIIGNAAYSGAENQFLQTVTAMATPTFSVGISPVSMTLTQGASGRATVMVTPQNGFTGNVTLTAPYLPNGVTASFGTNPTTGSSVLTLTASSTTLPAGFYSVGIAGSSGSISNILATLYLTVNPPPSFTLAASSSSLTVTQGAPVTDTITVTPQTGFTGSVTLSAPNLPSGITASFGTNPTTGSSVLTLNASNAVAPGNYTAIIIGTSGVQTVTIPLALTVSVGQGGTPVPAPSGNFGNVNIGTTSPALGLIFTFASPVTLGSIAAVMQGAAGLDFANAGTGSCTANTSYTAAETCTVNVTFTPRFAGTRYGAVVLESSSGSTIASGYLQGSGVGPEILFQPGTQSTLASGFTDPMAVAVDSSGNVYVADWSSNPVKEILAVNGSIPASPAINVLGSGFQSPMGVAVDGSGNVFVADYGLNAIYEILKAGGYTTVNKLGGGFNQPRGVAVDGSGNVFVADWGNNAVKEIPPGCVESTCVTTLGSGFKYPAGVAVDGSGNVFVADAGSDTIKEILAAGGYGTINTLANGMIFSPNVAVDGVGNLFVVNENAVTSFYTVLEIVAAGGYTTVDMLGGSFNFPYGLAVDGAGNVYVADTGNNRLVKMDYADPPSLSFVGTVVGSTSSDSPQTVTVENVGNAALNFPIPSTGNNPSIATNFTLNDSGISACTVLSASSSEPVTLAAGASCQLLISFTPTAAGALSGSLVLTDNNLNAAAPGYTTQSITLNGTGLQATPTLSVTSSSNPSTYGSSVTFTATISSGPTGMVTFYDSGTAIGTGSISGTTATFTSSTLAAGVHSITAGWAGNTNYGPVTSAAITQTVNAATPTLSVTSSSNPSTYGSPVTFTATISSGPTGTVTFYDSGSAIGTGSISGTTATFTSSTLAAGVHSITAGWAGNTNYNSVTSAAVTQTVNQATPTLSVTSSSNPSTYGSPVTFTATISSGPTGIVTFYDSGTAIGTGSISGATATFTTSTLALGIHSITAGWAGNTNYSPMTSAAITQTVNAATPTLSVASSGTPSTYGSPVTFTATISSGPTGTVTFYDGGTAIGTGSISGTTATFTSSTLAAGIHTITAGWAGNTSYGPVISAAITQTVGPNQIALPASGDIGTVAGNGAGSFSGDTRSATNAALYYPEGVALDSAGNLYIADMGNNRIRMVSALTGDISTVAGGATTVCSGASDSLGDGCAATSAKLNHPYNVALDSAGNLYIADYGDNVIRKVTAPIATGIISTVAGNGTAGYGGDGGAATASTVELNAPEGVAVDTLGNIYIADTGNSRVRMVRAATGYISTLAGTGVLGYSGDNGSAGSAVHAKLYQPFSLALDTLGNLYIADAGNNRIRKLTTPSNPATSIISTVVGNGASGYSGDNGPATSAELYYPTGVGVDGANNIYVLTGRTSGASNPANCAVREVFAATGNIYTVGGNGACGYSGDGGMATSAELNAPYGVSVAIDLLGNLYIPDENNHRVRAVVPSGNLTPTITWPPPAAITYGTPLSATQLDAVAGFSGVPATSCVYTPASGTVLAAGTQTLSVTCTPTGTTVYSPATATVSLTVSKVTPTLSVTSSSNPSTYGSPVTFTATISSGPTGTVTFYDSGSAIGTGSISGTTATFTSSTLAAGVHSITAGWAGNTNYNSVTSAAVTQTVNQAVLYAPEQK